VRLFTGEGDEFIAIVVDANPAGVRARIAEECPPSPSVAVGPAGGLTSHETGAALSAQFKPVSLGPHTLRVETAAICLLAGVVLWLEGVNARQGGGAP